MRHLDHVWAVLEQFGRSTPVKWSLHSFCLKVLALGLLGASARGWNIRTPTFHEGLGLQEGLGGQLGA